MEKYQYKGFKVNFCDSQIKSKEEVLKVETGTEEGTVRWIGFFVKETGFIWEHMKQEASIKTSQNYGAFTLPYKIILQPTISISGVGLAPGETYNNFLKYYTQNLKFMLNFDFNIDLGVRGKSGKSES